MKDLKNIFISILFGLLIIFSYGNISNAAPAGEIKLSESEQTSWGTSSIVTSSTSVTHVYQELVHIKDGYNNPFFRVVYFVCKKTPTVTTSLNTEKKNYTFKRIKNPADKVKAGTSLSYCVNYLKNNNSLPSSDIWYMTSIENEDKTAIVYILYSFDKAFGADFLSDFMPDYVNCFPNSKIGSIDNIDDVQRNNIERQIEAYEKTKTEVTTSKPSYVYNKDSRTAYDNSNATLTYNVTPKASYNVNLFSSVFNTSYTSRYNKIVLDLNFNFSKSTSTTNTTETNCSDAFYANLDVEDFRGTHQDKKVMLCNNKNKHKGNIRYVCGKHKCTDKYTSYKRCLDCQDYFDYTTHAPDYTSHNFVEKVKLYRPASCKYPGAVVFRCNRKIPYYTEEGETLYIKCDCETIRDDSVNYPALGHDENNAVWSITKNPTCRTYGERQLLCQRINIDADGVGHRCDNILKEEKLNMLGHKWGEWELISPATCTEKGLRERKCIREPIKVYLHSSEIYKCDAVEKEVYGPLGHNYQIIKDTGTKPTCIQDGKDHDKKCTRCGDIIKGKTLKATGHKEISIPAVAATCTKAGHTEGKKCLVCGKILMPTEVIEAKGHVWDSGTVTKYPTESESGEKKFTCTVCGKTSIVTFSINEDAADPALKPSPNPSTEEKKKNGVGIISEDGKTLTDEDGVKYRTAETVKQSQLKTNLKIADKKSGGKYQIIKTIKNKKTGKVTGGYLKYVAPYNKNCKTISATNKVKIGGVNFTVTFIGNNCAKECKNLRKVVIGNKVTTIGTNAFNGCSKLSSIRITSKSLKKVGNGAFKGISPKAKITVPESRFKIYKKKLKKAGLSSKAKIVKK